MKTISPASEMPLIAEALTIDAYTQPGASPNTRAVGSDAVLRIELSGPRNGHGLVIEAPNSTVRGLVINSSGEGIRITGSGSTGNRVEGNYLGTDPSGTRELGHGDYGIAIGGASNNTIGAMSALDGKGKRNLTNNGSGVDDYNPVFSPGGKKIAYATEGIQQTNPEGEPEIYVVNASNGTGNKNLTNNGADVYDSVSEWGVQARQRDNAWATGYRKRTAQASGRRLAARVGAVLGPPLQGCWV